MSQLLHHPLRSTMTDDDWWELGRSVQYGRISWPVGVEIVANFASEIPANHPMHPNNGGNSTSANVVKARAEAAAAKSANPWNHQVGGNHYKDCKIQPAEFSIANNLGFAEGNIVKYVTRYAIKGGIEDLRKAKHYIELLIDHLEKQGG